MVIYDKRTTSVVLTAIINYNFLVVYQPLLRMKSIFYNSYVALDFAVCIHTFYNGNLLLAPIYFKGFPVVGSRTHVLFTLFVFAYTYCCPTHIVLCLWFVFLRLVYPMLPVSLDCHFVIAPLVFSSVYFKESSQLPDHFFVTEISTTFWKVKVIRSRSCFLPIALENI